MRSMTPKLVFSIAEIALGLFLIALGLYYLSHNLNCPPDAFDCAGWGWLGFSIFTVPGALIAVAGAVSFFCGKLSFAVIQMCLVAVVVTYYFSGL